MIAFEELTIGHTQTIASVSLQQIEAGSMYAIIGSNGSGKSTFLKTICGQYTPMSGSIAINGKPLTELSRQKLAKMIAFVPAKFPDVEFMSVTDFIALGRTPYIGYTGRMNEADMTILGNIVEQLNISHLASKNTDQLSDGERQLCALARAMAQETPIILLDEPTSFLDYKNKRKILQLLKHISNQSHKIVLFSSHDIESLLQLDIQLIGVKNELGANIIEQIPKSLPFDALIESYYP